MAAVTQVDALPIARATRMSIHMRKKELAIVGRCMRDVYQGPMRLPNPQRVQYHGTWSWHVSTPDVSRHALNFGWRIRPGRSGHSLSSLRSSPSLPVRDIPSQAMYKCTSTRQNSLIVRTSLPRRFSHSPRNLIVSTDLARHGVAAERSNRLAQLVLDVVCGGGARFGTLPASFPLVYFGCIVCRNHRGHPHRLDSHRLVMQGNRRAPGISRG